MANITVLQPSDYLKDSRTIINTNFANLNAAVSALSAGGGNINTYNISVSSGGTVYGVPNDRLIEKAAHIDIKTTNPLLNGSITLSANNGGVVIDTIGPGLTIKDDLQQSNFGGVWLELERANPLSASVNSGPVYKFGDAVQWPRAGESNEGLQIYGTRKDSSIAITSFTGYINTIPGIYVPSVSSATNYGAKVELIGPNGAQTKQLLVGYAPLYGNFGTSALSANNILIFPTSSDTITLSAYKNLKSLATEHTIGTVNPLLNGNITLSANNGYIIFDTVGTGIQIKDNLNETTYGGNWIEFYRTNAASSVFVGTAYKIADAVQWPRAGESNEGLQIYGTRKDSSIAITSSPGYKNSIPGIYIPSLSAVNSYDSKVELVGPKGALTRRMTVGNAPLYGNFDNNTSITSANNLIIYADPIVQSGFGTTDQSMVLSAFDAFRTVASHYIIGTSNPNHNGNITLSANNGYIQHKTTGTGTQLIDDLQGQAFGGTWLEFYRVNGYPGVSAGTRFAIGDRPWWPKFGDDSNEGLTLYGLLSSTSIAITSGPGYNDVIPGIYVPSRLQALSGYKIEMEIYEFGTTPVSSANVTTFLDNGTRTVVMSALEPTTSITIQAGTKGKISLKSAGFGYGLEKDRYLEIEGRTINVKNVNNGPARLQINSDTPGYAGLNLIQDPAQTYGDSLTPFGTFWPVKTAGDGESYARGLVINARGESLLLTTTGTANSANSATDIILTPYNNGSIKFSLLSGANSTSTSAVSLKLYRDNNTIIFDANPDVYPTPGIGYADFRIENSSKSYGVQIPKLQVDIINNYNSGNITLSARDSGSIIVVPATSADNLWVQNGGLKFPDGTRQTTATVQGIQGTQGITGIQGPSDGASGYSGISGYSGTQGTTGIQGASGYSGETGAQGTSGYSGETGAQGTSGYSGEIGAQGITGAQGPSDGASGYSGISGYSGTQGTTGIQGTSGYSGETGAQGTSGYSGETGAQGTSGYSGEIGAQGPTGDQGIEGVSGYSGEQGTIGAQGIDGVQGPTGAQGPDGNQGIIGAQGPTGAQGTDGGQGIIGAQGLEGPQGTQGPEGGIGGMGIQGITGTEGAQGIIGPQGTAGPQGIEGISGYSGVQGTIGTAGITVDTVSYPPSAFNAPGTTNTFIVSAGIAYLCTTTDIWVKWTVDTTW